MLLVLTLALVFGGTCALVVGGAMFADRKRLAAARAVKERLAANRTYNVYLWDDRNVKRLEASPEAPVVDPVSGNGVKEGDATRLFVGRVRTDASGGFVEAR